MGGISRSVKPPFLREARDHVAVAEESRAAVRALMEVLEQGTQVIGTKRASRGGVDQRLTFDE